MTVDLLLAREAELYEMTVEDIFRIVVIRTV
jgi:hypothetical protein